MNNQNLDKSVDFFGSKGRKLGDLANPQSICIIDNLIFVTDSSNQRVSAFDLSGLFKFHLLASLEYPLKRPVGITRHFDDTLLVSDYERRYVLAFEKDGSFKKQFGKVRFLGPKGICVNKFSNNEVIVADCKANLVYILDLNGKFLVKFGEKFSAPHYVICSSSGDILVSDFYNHCVKIFNSRGCLRLKFDGNFQGPTGLGVDLNDNIFVADWGRSRIQKFSKDGKFIREIDLREHPLNGPQDLKIYQNRLVIADPGNYRICFFKIE